LARLFSSFYNNIFFFQANTLGTKTIDEDGFFDLIRNTPGKKSSYDPSPVKPAVKKTKSTVNESPAPKPSPSKTTTATPQPSMVESQNSQQSVSSVGSQLTQSPSGSPLVKGMKPGLKMMAETYWVLWPN